MALSDASIRAENVDGIAFTRGPGMAISTRLFDYTQPLWQVWQAASPYVLMQQELWQQR